MQSDTIIQEIHKIRQEHAKKFNYNLFEIFNDLKEQEKKSGRQFVSLPIKRKKKLLKDNLKNKLIKNGISYEKTD
ncbi:MAG: hypothetical protein HQK79_19835 [Desulfobacterales bacterium]|nr:hypothetical protein [Desulfobacterales bacterium]